MSVKCLNKARTVWKSAPRADGPRKTGRKTIAGFDSALGALLTELADTRGELKCVQRDITTSKTGAAVVRVGVWIVEHWWPFKNHIIPKALTHMRLTT